MPSFNLFSTALAALFLSTLTVQALSTPPSHGLTRRHAGIRSAFSLRTKRQSSLSTTQPSNLAQSSATADEGCTLWITPNNGDSCLSVISNSPGLILSDFYDLNPSIDSSCSNLQTNLAYCIDTDDSHDGSTTSPNNALASPSSCKGTKTSKSPAATSKSSSASPKASAGKKVPVIGLGGSLLELDDPVCGPSDPTEQTTDQGGPNGKTSWLNCGISTSDPSSGWTYPDVKLSEIKYQNMSKTGIYAPCAPYFKYFEEAEAKYNIPAIFFAAFAMQESTCNPNASGDEGHAWGLMQITTDKCGSAPNGNCNDPEYNVMTAASYFATTLQNCNDNPLCAVGAYNGWFKGMSYNDATAQKNSCCVCQNNLDYQTQFFVRPFLIEAYVLSYTSPTEQNAWIHNLDGLNYTPYDNLRVCTSWWNGK